MARPAAAPQEPHGQPPGDSAPLVGIVDATLATMLRDHAGKAYYWRTAAVPTWQVGSSGGARVLRRGCCGARRCSCARWARPRPGAVGETGSQPWPDRGASRAQSLGASVVRGLRSTPAGLAGGSEPLHLVTPRPQASALLLLALPPAAVPGSQQGAAAGHGAAAHDAGPAAGLAGGRHERRLCVRGQPACAGYRG